MSIKIKDMPLVSGSCSLSLFLLQFLWKEAAEKANTGEADPQDGENSKLSPKEQHISQKTHSHTGITKRHD